MITAAQPPSETPRTDAAMCVLHPGVQPSVWYVQATVCREIERDLAAAQAAVKGTDSTIRALRADCDAAQATIARQAEELERVRKDAEDIHIVFDGPPGPIAGRFVEVEDASGKGMRLGEWQKHGEYWHLVFRAAITKETAK